MAYLTKLLKVLSTVSIIALAAARGIQKSTGSGQLNELGRGWSKSFMEHISFAMTKNSL